MNTTENIGIRIITFEERYAVDFAQLNFAWIREHFVIEEYDREILTNPHDQVLKNGGEIFFALENEKAVGTVAMIRRERNVFELAKMAVADGYKGRGIGNLLMDACLDHAIDKRVHQVFLDSNTKLTPAITLYRKYGFKEVPLPDTPYERGNIRMELHL